LAVLAEEQSTTVKERNESTRDEQCTLARAVRAVGRRLERIKLGYLYFKSTGGRQDLASVRKMVFLCYGNICRSAFAEHYARKVFGQRGIRVEILSRGTCAIPGKRSPDLAVEAARVFGVDLIDHEAQALDEEDLRACDMVIGMDLRNFDLFRKKFLVYRRKFFYWGTLFADWCSGQV
jgi:protein-tyrosine-phosphatase